MPVTYSVPTASDDVLKLLAGVMAKYHQPLATLGVQIGVLFASTGAEDDSPAVKHHGYAALATIKVMPLKERVTKKYDAELVIDEREWDGLSAKAKVAMLDHELEHLQPRTKLDKKTGEAIQLYDDIGRPKLKTVKADFDVGDCFATVIARHGEDAIEFFNIKRAHGKAMAALKGEVG